MLILGIDTSGRQATIALLRADAEAAAASPAQVSCPQVQTLELADLGDARASEVLVPGIAALLQKHGVAKNRLSLVAVASGPGSFTGLRVALATAKGLAEAFAIPVVAVSVLEALAVAAAVAGRVVAALDAQRGELFFGEYIVGFAAGGSEACEARCVREEIAAWQDFIAEFGGHSAPDGAARVITPDDALAGRLREAGLDAKLITRPGAEQIARIALAKFLAGQRVDVATLDANYLRRSDAEIVFSRKPGDGQQK